MNAAMSSSVVLASRLSEDLAVFALMLFSVQVFALFPMLRQRLQVRLVFSNHLVMFTGIQNTAIILQVLMTLFLSCICLCLAGQKSTSAYTLSAATLFFVTFIAPAILVWAQRYKKLVDSTPCALFVLMGVIVKLEVHGTSRFLRSTDIDRGVSVASLNLL